ncbi:TM2 domain-containing protein [Pelomonas cellulosilytica]|uniref:TM2 domain-containing protein n=1 Tax=Pelomonas cellulosilytica TaxID=2906762 RepID=A0ABS8XQZ2_9BURK|nr:TM2 domain-containing protein [Pelomonas sp. P8]MCE4555152.1 TM2 domain-containing protein [Pelomonas sp. P8]
MTAVKRKAVATWLALLVGVFGVHRFYLHGLKDRWGWLFPLPTLLGLTGLQRMDSFGQDDRLAWVLIPCLGASLVAALLGGIVYGLTPDERWNARFNPSQPAPSSGWVAIIGVVLCLFVGGIALMSTIAFSAQRYFEAQAVQ